MFWKRICRKNLFDRDNSVRGSRIRGSCGDGKNLMGKPVGIGNGDGCVSRKRKVRTGLREDRVRKKRKMKGNGRRGDMNDGFDRISDLPEPIIHLIFGFLRSSKDVVRTSVLSKKWKSMFDSYLTFDFDETYFHAKGLKGKHNRIKAREIGKKRFMNYVESSLAQRLGPLQCIDKFRLYLKYNDELRWDCITRWLCVALHKNVKELELHAANVYILPNSVLSSTSITCLKLSACLLNGSSINLRNLKILSLKEAMASSRLIDKFQENCPMVEDLRLIRCTGPTCVLKFAFSKLRRLEIHECPYVIAVEIEAPCLETFWYHTKRNKECDIDLKACGNLKNLTLKASKMTDKMLQGYISVCPSLENLVLQECNSLKRLTILSQKLKNLSLIKCQKLLEANVDAPNLYSYHYTGGGLSLYSMNVLGLREAKFFFGLSVQTSQLFLGNKFFENFCQSSDLKLIIYSKKEMKIFGEPTQASRITNSFDKLELCASSAAVQRIVDSWLRGCSGKCLTLLSPGDDLSKAMNKMIKRRDGNPNCCSLYKKKCWRHYLEDVKVKNLRYENGTYYDLKWRVSNSQLRND